MRYDCREFNVDRKADSVDSIRNHEITRSQTVARIADRTASQQTIWLLVNVSMYSYFRDIGL